VGEVAGVGEDQPDPVIAVVAGGRWAVISAAALAALAIMGSNQRTSTGSRVSSVAMMSPSSLVRF